jgi:hypothetical protein
VTAPVSIPATVGAGIVGGVIGYVCGESITSDIWAERTERHTYMAPDGHFIHADPTY